MNGWEAISKAARGPTEDMRIAMADPRKAQLDLLHRLLSRNERTRFGVSHGFSSIRTVQDFRRFVPVRSFEGIEPWIKAAAAGEADVLTAEPVLAFERTGGSTAGGKLIPYTGGLLGAFRAAVLPWLGRLLERRPAVASGRAYVSVSPAARTPEYTAGGLPIGLPSEGAYLGAELAPAFASILVNGAAASSATEIGEWQRATLCDLVTAEDLKFISVWSPTFLTRLLDALETEPDAILSDCEANRAPLAVFSQPCAEAR